MADGRTARQADRSQQAKARRSARPTLRQLFVWFLLAAATVYTAALVMVLIVSQQDQRRPVDAIVVLGAAQYNGRPSPVLRARLNHALHLFREGHAPRIIVTGGRRRDAPSVGPAGHAARSGRPRIRTGRTQPS